MRTVSWVAGELGKEGSEDGEEGSFMVKDRFLLSVVTIRVFFM